MKKQFAIMIEVEVSPDYHTIELGSRVHGDELDCIEMGAVYGKVAQMVTYAMNKLPPLLASDEARNYFYTAFAKAAAEPDDANSVRGFSLVNRKGPAGGGGDQKEAGKT